MNSQDLLEFLIKTPVEASLVLDFALLTIITDSANKEKMGFQVERDSRIYEFTKVTTGLMINDPDCQNILNKFQIYRDENLSRDNLKKWLRALDNIVIRKGSPENYLSLELIGEGGQASVIKI